MVWLFILHLLKMKKIFLALGNNRPQILVQLEDRILHAIIAISEGESSETVIDALHLQILLLEKDLDNNDEALNWFDLSMATFSSITLPSKIPSTPLAGMCI